MVNASLSVLPKRQNQNRKRAFVHIVRPNNQVELQPSNHW